MIEQSSFVGIAVDSLPSGNFFLSRCVILIMGSLGSRTAVARRYGGLSRGKGIPDGEGTVYAMRFHGRELGLGRRLGVTTRTIIGVLLVLLVVAAVACEDAEPNATVEPTLPGPLVEVTDVEVVYASRERQPPFLLTGDYDPLWGDLDTDVPIIEKLLNSIVMGTPVDLKAGTGASKREIVTMKTGWGGDEVEIEAFDGRTWLSDRSMAINIAFRDGTIWSVRQVIGCDVISEGRVNNCLAVPDHWELLHHKGVVVSTALTEWFERVEEYMPSVEHYGVPDQIRLGEPLSISGAGYHEGDRVELSIEFIDQSMLPLGEVPLDHGAFRWDGEFPETAATGYAIVSMRVFEGTEEVGGLTVSTTVTRSTAAGATTPSPTPAETEYSAADLARWYERLVDVTWRVPGFAWTDLNEARNRIEIGIYPCAGLVRNGRLPWRHWMSHEKPLSSKLDVTAFTHGLLTSGNLRTRRSSEPSTIRWRWCPTPLTERRCE